MRPSMRETHSREWLTEEAVRRWVLRSRAILPNIAKGRPDAEVLEFLLAGARGWQWNGGKTHLQLIREEFSQLSHGHDDGWRVVRA